MKKETKRIIIAEDDPLEQKFIRSGFEKSGKFSIVGIEPNGHKLVRTLEGMSDDTLPDIILSDINMPLMTGLEALVEVKRNEKLNGIPFFLFSSSKEESTMNTCYELGADKFLVKPESLNDYERFARELEAFV
jgi:CheY-like chemotaxis protein